MIQTGGLTQRGVQSGTHLSIHLDRERLKEEEGVLCSHFLNIVEFKFVSYILVIYSKK